MSADGTVGDGIVDIVNALGFEMEESGYWALDFVKNGTVDVVDPKDIHSAVAHDSIPNLATTLCSDRALRPQHTKIDKKVPSCNTNAIRYRGTGFICDPENALSFEVLTSASPTAFVSDPSADLTEDYPLAVGSSILFIGAMQAHNNARVVVSGSTDFFSDRARNNTDNAFLALHVSSWAFGLTGRLSVTAINHACVPTELHPRCHVTLPDASATKFHEYDMENSLVRFVNHKYPISLSAIICMCHNHLPERILV